MEGRQETGGSKDRRRSVRGGGAGVDGLELGARSRYTGGGTVGGTRDEASLGASSSSGAELSGADD